MSVGPLVTALTEPIRIEMVNDSFCFTDLIGPGLIAGAAVYAAYLAAKTSRENHKEQLDDANDRMRRELAHDREMRQRESTQQMLDELGVLMSGMIDDTGDFAGAVQHRSATRQRAATAETLEEKTELTVEGNEVQLSVNELLPSAYAALNRGLAARFRLRLRFRDDDPIVEAFDAWHTAIEAWVHKVRDLGGGDVISDTDQATLDQLSEDSSNALRHFTAQVQAWIQTERDSDPFA